MIASEFKDIDGFRLQFEESVPDDERTFYMRTFLRVDDVAKDRVHCTTCDVHVGTAPISEKIIRTHQILGVTQCNKCFAFYQNSGEFGKGEDGSEYYCRWCGQGGEVFCCSTCPFVFCNKCIKDNLTMAYIKEIERNDDWSCFVCNRETLKRLRAQHWALRNFMNKQLEKIQNVNINSEEELNTMLNDDKATCCPKKKRKQILKPTIPAPVKRPAMNGGGLTLAGPPAKKQIIAPTKMLKVPVNTNYHLTKPGPKPQPPASFSKPRNNDEVVCTPDILGLFNNKTQNPGQRPLAATAPPPLIMRQNQRPVRPMASTNAAGNPIYHTVNGFQIDLNQAARQEIFRLPNGKLIQVRKQPNSSQSSSQVRPGLHLQMQPRVPHIPIRPAPPTITTTSRMMRPTMAPQLRVARPQVAQQRPQPSAAAGSSGQVASTVFTQQNGSISVARAPQPDTPYGKAKTAFEDKIINGLEICQHTINKMITLTNSSSFKTSRSFADLKELYIHLQYLFTYTSGKIKTLQDSLATNVEELAKHDKSLKEKEKHDEDELEIVEQKQDVIEVLSDDEVEVPTTTKAFATKRTAKRPSTEQPPEPADFEQEIMSAIVATMQNSFARKPDQMELLASCNYVSDDQKLLTKSAVKVERLEDAKSPIIKQYMIAIQQRRDREPSVEQDEGENADEGDDDFPPLVPEIVMDENPNPEESETAEATAEKPVEAESAEKTLNETSTSDVVEIPSDDEDTSQAEKKDADVENEQKEKEETEKADESKAEEQPSEEVADDSNKSEELISTVDLSELLEVADESNVNEESKSTDEVEQMEVDANETTENLTEEVMNETVQSENSEDASFNCTELLDTTENVTEVSDTTENITEVLDTTEDVLESTENFDTTENGTAESDASQIKDSSELLKESSENCEDLAKLAENGIDEKDLLDNLINSLDENEPLAPIELENFIENP